MGRNASSIRLAGQPLRGVVARDAAGPGADQPVQTHRSALPAVVAPCQAFSDRTLPRYRTLSAPGSRVTVPGPRPASRRSSVSYYRDVRSLSLSVIASV